MLHSKLYFLLKRSGLHCAVNSLHFNPNKPTKFIAFFVPTFHERYRPETDVSHISTLWYWNCSCVILYLSDSTSRTSIFAQFLLPLYTQLYYDILRYALIYYDYTQ